MYLVAAIIGYAMLAGVNILDKFILSKKSVKPLVFVFYSSVFLLPLALLLPFGVQMLSGIDWLTAIIAGGSFVAALWALFLAFAKSEVSHVSPLSGGLIPLFILPLSWLFIGEAFSKNEYLGIILLITGCLLISFEKSRDHNGWHSGILWAIVASLFFAISHVTSKFIYVDYGFYSGLVWTRLWIGILGVLVLLSPATRQAIFSKKSRSAKKKSRGNVLLIFINKFLAVIAIILVQYGIAIGSVVIVNALAGVQYAVLVIAVALLSKFFPKLFHEDYGRVEIWQEIIAVLVIAGGLICLL